MLSFFLDHVTLVQLIMNQYIRQVKEAVNEGETYDPTLLGDDVVSFLKKSIFRDK